MSHPRRDLGTIQRWMQSVITNPAGVDAGLRSPAAQEEIDLAPDDLEQIVTRSKSLGALGRLDVYASAYYARLLECLEAEFPALVHALGDEAFAEFAVEYLQAYPSTSYTLSDLAARFPQYLEETRPTDEPEGSWPDFLIDLARLERTYAEVFDGRGTEDEEPLAPGVLASLSPEEFARARLVPAPCLRLLALRFPVHEYATAVRCGKEPDIPERASIWLVITRRDYVVRRVPVSEAQFALLGRLIEMPVAEAIAQSAASADMSADEYADSLRNWFTQWSRSRFFVRVEVDAAI
jgi:hypothetical protein